MSKQQEPKKPKAKKLNLNNKKNWRDILSRVEKQEVPIQVLEKIGVNLLDGTTVVVDIKKLLAEGIRPDDLEQHVTLRLDELDHYIENVDFFVDIEMVEKTVQPETDRILGKL
jgi:hypothetical protein